MSRIQMIKFIRYCGGKNTIGINNRWIAQKTKQWNGHPHVCLIYVITRKWVFWENKMTYGNID